MTSESAPHVELPAETNGDAAHNQADHQSPRDSKGWDGKLRLEKRPVITNSGALSDPEHSDEDALPVEQIEADEGGLEAKKRRKIAEAVG
jgi:protein phosphatase 1 regulatory subunit 7